MTWLGPRSLACMLVLIAPACVIKLSDRNSPSENGGVTGAAADCSKVQAPPHATIGPSPEIKFVGRFDMRDPKNIQFDWSGSVISARFEGPQVSARLEAIEGDVLFSAVVDGGQPREIHVVSRQAQPKDFVPPQSYLLADGLGPGPHEIVLHRDTEAQSGITVFRGFDFGGGRLLPPTQRARRIELIGDSITCGYGDEGLNATCPFDIEVRRFGNCPAGALSPNFEEEHPDCNIAKVPFTENQYLAYGSIVGRKLDADVTTLCWSGRGVYRNYREPKDPATGLPDPTKPAQLDAATTIPMMWRDRTIGGKRDFPPPGTAPEDLPNYNVPWDFTKEPEPQIVVINLGTNDFTRDTKLNNQGNVESKDGLGDNVPDADVDLEKLRTTFRDFVRDVRAKRPNAHIFLAVPPMITDQYPTDNARKDLEGVLQGIASDFETAGDAKVYAMDLVEQGTRYGLGCDYHPNLRVHEIMAEQVAGAIRSKTCWD